MGGLGNAFRIDPGGAGGMAAARACVSLRRLEQALLYKLGDQRSSLVDLARSVFDDGPIQGGQDGCGYDHC